MTLPFTVAQFFEVFERYNQVIWPAQIIAYLAAFGLLALIAAGSAYAGRIGAAVLGVMWLLNGIGYHIGYFSEINGAALAFGGLFILQAVLIGWLGLVERRVGLEARHRLGHRSLEVQRHDLHQPADGNDRDHQHDEQRLVALDQVVGELHAECPAAAGARIGASTDFEAAMVLKTFQAMSSIPAR